MTETAEAPQKREDRLAAALEWDWGTAYDLLLSVQTILRPKQYGVPAPWAAGVRKRLSVQSQADLKTLFSQPFGVMAYTPLHLVLEMDQPKDARRFLDYVEAIPDQDFTRRLLLPLSDEGLDEIMDRTASGQEMSDAEVEECRHIVARLRLLPTPSTVEVRRLFREMADSATTKRRWLSLMREYYSAFFAEEEKREKGALEKMLEDAQALSRTASLPDMIERLSNGFTISPDIDLNRLVMAPSVWCHPFVVTFQPTEREMVLVWGARPPGYKLVPGESVPDEAMLVLRALGDPTRLRLLRLIAAEPRSLQALAHDLKLSLPTVSHHIRELRVSGLIRLEVGGGGRESKYTVRWPSAQKAFDQLEEFVMRETDS